MEYGTPELFFNMFKAFLIGLAVGYVIWGWKRKPVSETTDDTPAAEAEPPAEASAEPETTAEADAPDLPPAPAPKNLFTETPDQVDDLKKIKGVGPKMESVLNAKGVYQFAQIAAFTDEDLRGLDAATKSFPGRAERDGWVAQAKALS
ncbi:MAG: hypothetical protein AAGC57_16270 [Pseudomonadota bacterium]